MIKRGQATNRLYLFCVEECATSKREAVKSLGIQISDLNPITIVRADEKRRNFKLNCNFMID